LITLRKTREKRRRRIQPERAKEKAELIEARGRRCRFAGQALRLSSGQALQLSTWVRFARRRAPLRMTSGENCELKTEN